MTTDLINGYSDAVNSTLDQYEQPERQAARIIGKGWTVLRSKGKKLQYVGYAQRHSHRVVDGTPTPRWEKKEDAVRYAIIHAHKAGTLDWKKTVRWMKVMGLQVNIEGLELPKVFRKQKGWYLSREKGGRYYQIKVGKSHDDSLYWGIGATPYTVLRKAVGMGLMSEPYFDYDSSIIWLKQKGYDDCVGLLKKKKAV